MNPRLSILALLALLTVGPARADEADLAAPAAESGPSLRLYGFADFSYSRYVFDAGSYWDRAQLFPKNGAFSVGNLNLFLDGQLSERARSLIEIRFTYLPNGSGSQVESGSSQTRIGTLVGDYAAANTVAQWGGIIIERAWAEYAFSDVFTLRAGQFLTPYGVWNVDHGSVALIDVAPPYAITQQMFPRTQVGLEAYGSRYFGASRLGWHLTLSNGRMQSTTDDHVGAVPQYLDFDHRFGVGGRAFAELRGLGELRIGASFYAGRYTEAVTRTSEAGRNLDLVQQYDEVAFGADVRWTLGHFLLIGEVVVQNVAFTDQGRTALTAALGRDAPYPDYTASGGYLLAGYRLPWGEVMPFAMLQRHSPNDQRKEQALIAATAGVNVRLLPGLVLKASVTKPIWTDAGPNDRPYSESLLLANAQVAWAF